MHLNISKDHNYFHLLLTTRSGVCGPIVDKRKGFGFASQNLNKGKKSMLNVQNEMRIHRFVAPLALGDRISLLTSLANR
jgi:hypothetical protein